jgi:predicted Zn-ribbon and HTH transcriptional regulator
MNHRIYHGHLTPYQISNALVARFNRGNLRAQQFGTGEQIVVQVASGAQPVSGGTTALTVTLQKIKEGVVVQIGRQAWLGLAASLGVTALSALRNPFSLLGRLDDLAQDIENLTLTEQVWETVEEVASTLGASLELSERLRKLVCEYCQTANPLEEPSCIACGAPLGRVQPRTCLKCGFVLRSDESNCPNCKMAVPGRG